MFTDSVAYRYCQITAREAKVKSIPKLWIPKEQWWDIDEMYKWAESNFPKLDFNRVFRLSQISKHEPAKQLLIPTYLLAGNGLDLQVSCKANWRDLPSTKLVDYSKWPNTYGKPQ